MDHSAVASGGTFSFFKTPITPFTDPSLPAVLYLKPTIQISGGLRPLELFIQKHFAVGKILGEGEDGKVFLATSKETGRLFALKQIKLKGNVFVERTVPPREVKVGLLLPDPDERFVQYRGAIIGDPEWKSAYIFGDFCNHGTLQNLLDSYSDIDSHLPEALIWHTVHSLLGALATLHRLGVAHHDIDPKNIFVHWPEGADRDKSYPFIKLADYGVAAMAGPDGQLPEGEMTFDDDRLLLGQVIYEMVFHGDPQFGKQKYVRALPDMTDKPVPKSPNFDPAYSVPLLIFLKELMRRDDDAKSIVQLEEEYADEILKHSQDLFLSI